VGTEGVRSLHDRGDLAAALISFDLVNIHIFIVFGNLIVFGKQGVAFVGETGVRFRAILYF